MWLGFKTRVGLQHLYGLPSLRTEIKSIVLDALATAGFHRLGGLPSLQRITAAYTNVSDDGLLALAALTSLRRLVLDSCQARQEHPICVVLRHASMPAVTRMSQLQTRV